MHLTAHEDPGTNVYVDGFNLYYGAFKGTPHSWGDDIFLGPGYAPDVPLNRAVGDPFDALGDPQRRAIVELLREGERSVQEIADELPISRPSVSRHLRLLSHAGLVVAEPRGTRRLYRLHHSGVEAVGAYLRQVWGEAATRLVRGERHRRRPRREEAQWRT